MVIIESVANHVAALKPVGRLMAPWTVLWLFFREHEGTTHEQRRRHPSIPIATHETFENEPSQNALSTLERQVVVCEVLDAQSAPGGEQTFDHST